MNNVFEEKFVQQLFADLVFHEYFPEYEFVDNDENNDSQKTEESVTEP